MTSLMPDILELPAGVVVEEERDLAGGTADAVFNASETHRLLLTRVWEPGLPLACWVMLNPSTATATIRDNTLGRVVTFSHGFGCGGLAIVNLFALRSRHPTALTKHDDPVGEHNDLFIRHTVRTAAASGGRVIAAWGSWGDHTKLRPRTAAVTGLLRAARVPVMSLGTTSAVTGHQPLHPLMLHGDTTLRPYSLEPLP